MNSPNDDLRLHWQAQPRPEWVSQVNREGSYMELNEVVPLDEKSLLDTAIRATGLSDFGAEDWREPFQILIKSMEEDAELNLVGRLRARTEVVNLLKGRLQIEDTYKRHPEINDEQIIQPIIVIGQGRSGTSFLLNTLSHNPDNGVLKHWEMMFPCPPPEKATYLTDPRIEKADKLITIWNRVTPEIQAMHQLGGKMPFEDCAILAFNFMSPSWFDCMGQVSTYDRYILQQDMDPAFRYHQRILKLLQWKNPRRHWVLKDPMHLDRFRTILKYYPDACFVWPHRDPMRALASFVSIIGTIQWGRSDHPFKGGSLEYFTDPELQAARFNMVIDQIENGVVPAKQIHNIYYKDLVADTIGTIEGMYRHFGIPLSAEGHDGMVKYLTENPREKRPPHRFDAGTEEAVARARRAFKRYQEYFGVESE